MQWGQEPGGDLGPAQSQASPQQCPGHAAHMAALGRPAVQQDTAQTQHHRVLEHGQAAWLPPRAAGAPPGRQAKPQDQYGQPNNKNWEPLPSHRHSQQLWECPHGSRCLPAPPHNAGVP